MIKIFKGRRGKSQQLPEVRKKSINPRMIQITEPTFNFTNRSIRNDNFLTKNFRQKNRRTRFIPWLRFGRTWIVYRRFAMELKFRGSSLLFREFLNENFELNQLEFRNSRPGESVVLFGILSVFHESQIRTANVFYVIYIEIIFCWLECFIF